jgi:hypothetical protein
MLPRYRTAEVAGREPQSKNTPEMGVGGVLVMFMRSVEEALVLGCQEVERAPSMAATGNWPGTCGEELVTGRHWRRSEGWVRVCQ